MTEIIKCGILISEDFEHQYWYCVKLILELYGSRDLNEANT